MKQGKHPYNYDLRARFPHMRSIKGYEGGSILTAEQDGKWYVIVSEAVMADFLMPGEDDDLLSQLVRVLEFDSEGARVAYIAKRST